jgi:predicted acyl esterase
MRALTDSLAHQEDQTMYNFMDAKLMAKLLRQALAERGIERSHSDCLELVSRQFGFANWNILSARIEAMAAERVPLVMPEGWINGSVRQNGHFRMGLDPDHAG